MHCLKNEKKIKLKKMSKISNNFKIINEHNTMHFKRKIEISDHFMCISLSMIQFQIRKNVSRLFRKLVHVVPKKSLLIGFSKFQCISMEERVEPRVGWLGIGFKAGRLTRDQDPS